MSQKDDSNNEDAFASGPSLSVIYDTEERLKTLNKIAQEHGLEELPSDKKNVVKYTADAATLDKVQEILEQQHYQSMLIIPVQASPAAPPFQQGAPLTLDPSIHSVLIGYPAPQTLIDKKRFSPLTAQTQIADFFLQAALGDAPKTYTDLGYAMDQMAQGHNLTYLSSYKLHGVLYFGKKEDIERAIESAPPNFGFEIISANSFHMREQALYVQFIKH